MSVTSGFFNSLSGDRKYDARQMSQLFDGLINDGIFESIGDCFAVKSVSDLNLTVGTGRAWFNHTWTYNDAILPLAANSADLLLDRIDAVVIEVNDSDGVRQNSIKIVEGVAASSPVNPVLSNSGKIFQHALAYIYRKAGSNAIRQADITNKIGTDETPFVTGILRVTSLDELLGQWQDELDRFVENEEADYSAWYAAMKEALEKNASDLDIWTENEKESILAWFEHMKGQLDVDSAANLQNQIDRADVERILLVGLTDGEKTFSDDGTTITTIDSAGRKYVKTFTDGFLTCTSVLTDASGGFMGQMVKKFSSDGKVISSEVRII
ncbi:MAG: hypothetical protein Q4C65_02390 [Eubacteriales bacterium]|nr:hypothetical protein [Eubacteriales bacterium]